MLHRIAGPLSIAWFVLLVGVAFFLTWETSDGGVIKQVVFGYITASFGMSLYAFMVMGLDKRIAIRNRSRESDSDVWRIGENTLHLISALGGWLGCLGGQKLFRHKTSKRSFQWVFWAIGCMHFGLISAIGLASFGQTGAAWISAGVGIAIFALVGLVTRALH